MKKPRGRPRKNLLTNLKNIPSQTKRKRGRPRKQIYEDELPEIYAQKRNQTKVESDSYSDPDIRCATKFPLFFFMKIQLYCEKMVTNESFQVLLIVSYNFCPSFW